ncbi:sensor histidine kinase [Paenibacillus cymbidii]|uniref:sensor histidine kinase n=1 Tax=Paenibacillus cymbidii TaxID=1639034 RepID=UPI0010817C06|nr:histidine kinase [Paenibacillus cymbidii]
MSFIRRIGRRFRSFVNGLQYRQKLLVTIAMVALVPLLLLSAVYMSAYARAKLQAIMERNIGRHDAQVEQLDRMFYAGIKKLIYLSNNLQVIQLLSQDYSDDLLAYMNNLTNVQGVLEALKSDELQSGVAVYGVNPSLYRTENIRKIGDLDPSVRERVMSNKDAYPVRTFVKLDDGRTEVRIYSQIMDLKETLAITEVTFPLDSSLEAIRRTVTNGSFVMYRQKDGVRFLIGTNGIDDAEAERAAERYVTVGGSRGYYIVPMRINAAQDDLLLFVDRTPVYLKLAESLAWPAVMLVGLLLTIFFSIKFVTFGLTRRLSELMGTVRGEIASLDAGPLPSADPFAFAGGREFAGPEAAPAEGAAGDELGQLDRAFHGLVVQIRDHYRQTAAYEVGKRQMEAELLQVNINPHVLYNTLSAIKWVYEDERLGQLIDDMVDFYRLFLNRGEPVAPLAQEIEMVKKYMAMHKFSYESDFTYEVDIDEALAGAMILRNTLQPVVENSLIHGINRLAAGGRISIAAREEGERAVIEVSDNGPGMERHLAERLATADADWPPALKPSGSGYALANIRRRIKLYYGDAFGLHIASEPGAGTKVTLTVPLGTAEPKVQYPVP